MSIAIKGSSKWLVCTDGDGVFHCVKLEPNLHLGTGQAFVIEADTEDEVISKVFNNPVRELEFPDDPKSAMVYKIPNLLSKKKAKSLIDAAATYRKNL